MQAEHVTEYLRRKDRRMETNRGTIVLAERAADVDRLRSVLREWGYKENEIHRVLNQQHAARKLDENDERSGQLTRRAGP